MKSILATFILILIVLFIYLSANGLYPEHFEFSFKRIFMMKFQIKEKRFTSPGREIKRISKKH